MTVVVEMESTASVVVLGGEDTAAASMKECVAAMKTSVAAAMKENAAAMEEVTDMKSIDGDEAVPVDKESGDVGDGPVGSDHGDMVNDDDNDKAAGDNVTEDKDTKDTDTEDKEADKEEDTAAAVPAAVLCDNSEDDKSPSSHNDRPQQRKSAAASKDKVLLELKRESERLIRETDVTLEIRVGKKRSLSAFLKTFSGKGPSVQSTTVESTDVITTLGSDDTVVVVQGANDVVSEVKTTMTVAATTATTATSTAPRPRFKRLTSVTTTIPSKSSTSASSRAKKFTLTEASSATLVNVDTDSDSDLEVVALSKKEAYVDAILNGKRPTGMSSSSSSMAASSTMTTTTSYDKATSSTTQAPPSTGKTKRAPTTIPASMLTDAQRRLAFLQAKQRDAQKHRPKTVASAVVEEVESSAAAEVKDDSTNGDAAEDESDREAIERALAEGDSSDEASSTDAGSADEDDGDGDEGDDAASADDSDADSQANDTSDAESTADSLTLGQRRDKDGDTGTGSPILEPMPIDEEQEDDDDAVVIRRARKPLRVKTAVEEEDVDGKTSETMMPAGTMVSGFIPTQAPAPVHSSTATANPVFAMLQKMGGAPPGSSPTPIATATARTNPMLSMLQKMGGAPPTSVDADSHTIASPMDMDTQQLLVDTEEASQMDPHPTRTSIFDRDDIEAAFADDSIGGPDFGAFESTAQVSTDAGIRDSNDTDDASSTMTRPDTPGTTYSLSLSQREDILSHGNRLLGTVGDNTTTSQDSTSLFFAKRSENEVESGMSMSAALREEMARSPGKPRLKRLALLKDLQNEEEDEEGESESESEGEDGASGENGEEGVNTAPANAFDILQANAGKQDAVEERPKKRTTFVEEEAEVEDDEYMNMGGADGDGFELDQKLREELAEFIDEDKEVIAKMTPTELRARLEEDESVQEFFMKQMRDTDLKLTKDLVRDIATGKIRDRRKHKQNLSKTAAVERDKFGRAQEEEEEDGAMRELDDVMDYGRFGDIINKYMENRRREQQERMRKRKRRDATSSEENDQSATADAEEGTGDHMRLDWTNESFTGGIQIAPGHVIETDLDRLEEKIKRRAVMQRMNNEHDSSIEVEDLKSATTTGSSSSFAFDSPPVNVMKLIKPKVRIQPRKPGASPFTSTYNKFAIRTTAAGSGFGRVNTSLNAGGSGKDHISPTTLAKLKSFDAACNGHRSVSVMKDSASASSTTGRRHGGFTVQRDKPSVAVSAASAASTRTLPPPLPSMKVAEKRKAGTGGKLMKMLEME